MSGSGEAERMDEVIIISDDEFENTWPHESEEEACPSQISNWSGNSLLTERRAEGSNPSQGDPEDAYFDPYDQVMSSQESGLSQSGEEPRVYVGAVLDRYILRRPKYRQYIVQLGITWTVEESDSEAEDPDPLVEFPLSPRRLAIADGRATPEVQEDPLLLREEEDLVLSGIDEDVLSLGGISISSLEEIIQQALQHQTEGETNNEAPTEENNNFPEELRAEITAAAAKGRRLCFRRDVGGRSYRIRISATGRVVVRCLEGKEEV